MLYADILVVVAGNSSVTQLDEYEVERIFLSKTRFFSDGEKVEVIEGMENELKDSFYRLIAHKSKSQLRSYWAKQIFTGKGKPPRQFKEDRLLPYLVQNTNAISYISSEQMTDTLKVIYKIKQ